MCTTIDTLVMVFIHILLWLTCIEFSNMTWSQ